MVKFGRHVDFFVGDPARRRLYVVPYKDVQRRTFADLPSPSSQPQHLPTPAAPRPLTPSIDDGTNAVLPMASASATTSGRSGLSALFDDNVDGYDADADAYDDVEGGNTADPSTSVNVRANAVTITAGTGAELAAALRAWSKLSVSQRGKKRASSKGTTTSTAVAMTTKTTSSSIVGFDLDGEMTEERLEEDVGVVEDDSEREFAIYFVSQRFQTEWRKCLGRASDGFDKAMQTFWREVSAPLCSKYAFYPGTIRR